MSTHLSGNGLPVVPQLATVLDLIDGAEGEGDRGTTAVAIQRHVATPDQVRWLLETEPPDLALIDRLLAITGVEAAEVLLDVLADAQTRTMRRALLERLARYSYNFV